MPMIITLTTDFGNSEYVGAMKGVIYSLCPDAKVVDITHEIRKYDIRRAAYILSSFAEEFPPGTVHCVVVDPGVGTKRKGVIVKTSRQVYVGPDNGVFSLVKGIEKVFEIPRKAKSKTFHGRDIFAPVAAEIACGSNVEEMGKEVKGVRRIIGDVKVKGNKITGEVICTDSFGNVITNIKSEMLDKEYGALIKIKVGGREYEMQLVESYGFAGGNEMICTIGSQGYMEIAVNMGDAGKNLSVDRGEKVEVER
ncbi:MAG: S-adenosyl-l-methionine hydroxide adenosyltransferase family protein [Candidatus Hydrothermarchaeaceae archaeon]